MCIRQVKTMAERFILGVCEKGLGLTDDLTKEQYLENDNTTLIRLCKVLNELAEENRALQKQLDREHQMLENAILLERTRMGKNCLKQYKDAIQ